VLAVEGDNQGILAYLFSEFVQVEAPYEDPGLAPIEQPYHSNGIAAGIEAGRLDVHKSSLFPKLSV